jgi:hypothetical protein
VDFLYLENNIKARNLKWKIIMFEIKSSHGGEDVDGGILCYDTVLFCRWLPTFL